MNRNELGRPCARCGQLAPKPKYSFDPNSPGRWEPGTTATASPQWIPWTADERLHYERIQTAEDQSQAHKLSAAGWRSITDYEHDDTVLLCPGCVSTLATFSTRTLQLFIDWCCSNNLSTQAKATGKELEIKRYISERCTEPHISGGQCSSDIVAVVATPQGIKRRVIAHNY